MPINENLYRWSVALGLCWVVLAVCLAGCSQMGKKRAEASEEGVYHLIEARLRSFGGFQAQGRLRLEHTDETLEVPFELRVSRAFELEVEGDLQHYLLPFEGQLRLVSDDEKTLVYTPAGVFDLAQGEENQASVRAFMLSLFGGGDWLLPWLVGRGCHPAAQTDCGNLSIQLEVHPTRPMIERWSIRDRVTGASFEGMVQQESHDSGGNHPPAHVVTGMLYPQRIAVYVEYRETEP